MICKNRIKNHTKTPICSGLLFFKDTLKSDVPNSSDIVFDSDICPSGKLRIYLNFG